MTQENAGPHAESEPMNTASEPAPPMRPATPVEEEALLRLLTYGRRTGWLLSVEKRRPVDARQKPLPWYTYPAISFLRQRVRPELSVLEFGSGNSILWWSARVADVTTIENHEGWAAAMRKAIPDNVTYRLILLEENGDYSRAASLDPDKRFDVIVIDGRDRVNCIRHSLPSLRENGVVLWDNAERERYQPGYEFLHGQGFRCLPFIGHGPGGIKEWDTSLFYRTDNCFGI